MCDFLTILAQAYQNLLIFNEMWLFLNITVITVTLKDLK